MVTPKSENNSHVWRATEMTPRDVWRPQSIFAGGEWEVMYIASARREHCAESARGQWIGQRVTSSVDPTNDPNFGHKLPQVAPAHENSALRIVGTQRVTTLNASPIEIETHRQRATAAYKSSLATIKMLQDNAHQTIRSRHTVQMLTIERTLPHSGVVLGVKVTCDGVGDQPASLHQ